MTENEQLVKGSCLCGAVTFTARLPAKWCAHCHCTWCRRAHGTAIATWASFDTDDVRMMTGADNLRRFHSTPETTRSFCGTCGTPLFFEGTRWPGELHIARGVLEDNADLVPDRHAYFGSKAPWFHLEDELRKHQGGGKNDAPDWGK